MTFRILPGLLETNRAGMHTASRRDGRRWHLPVDVPMTGPTI
ncbi:hypothetical protein [Parafrankia sp. EUN1f]|nr:hypothetical protein [Parafrankia sp. EUN1f]